MVRNKMLRYLRSPEAVIPKSRHRPGCNLDPHTKHVDRRIGENLEHCQVCRRQVRDQGCDGGYSILKACVHPRTTARQPEAARRFESGPGDRARWTGAASPWWVGIATS